MILPDELGQDCSFHSPPHERKAHTMSSDPASDPEQDPFDWEETQRPSTALSALSDFVGIVRFIWRVSASERKRLAKGFGLHLLNMGFGPVEAWILASIITLIPSLSAGQASSRLMTLLGAFALLKVVSAVADQYGGLYQFWQGINRLHYEWPMLCQEQLLSLPTEFHERHGMGKQVSKIIKGCGRMTDVTIDLFYDFAPTVAFWIVSTAILIGTYPLIAATLMIPVLLAGVLYAKLQQRVTPVWERMETRSDHATKTLIQSVAYASTVQAWVREAWEQQNQRTERTAIVVLEDEAHTLNQRYRLGISLCLLSGYFLSIAVAFLGVRNGTLSVSTCAYVMVTGQIVMDKLWRILQLYQRILRHGVSIRRVQALLDTPNQLPNNPAAPTQPALSYTLRCEQLTHQYAGRPPVLKNLNLIFSSGKMTALVGPSGGGKSTLIKLLMRIYDPTDGCVTLNGTPIRDLSRDWYRGLFAPVPQDTALFDDSVRANICYSVQNVSDKALRAAIEAAHLHLLLDDTKRFPKGLETVVGERGVMLSGGERQRVGIARAYLKILCGEARFLVLDEATASLDSEAEAAIQDAIARLQDRGDVTIIVIAHRLSTVRKADVIHVVKHGGIAESGTHVELIRRGGTYASLVQSQSLDPHPHR